MKWSETFKYQIKNPIQDLRNQNSSIRSCVAWIPTPLLPKLVGPIGNLQKELFVQLSIGLQYFKSKNVEFSNKNFLFFRMKLVEKGCKSLNQQKENAKHIDGRKSNSIRPKGLGCPHSFANQIGALLSLWASLFCSMPMPFTRWLAGTATRARPTLFTHFLNLQT